MKNKMITFSIYGSTRLKKGLEQMARRQKRTLSQQACFILEPVVDQFLKEESAREMNLALPLDKEDVHLSASTQ